MSKVMDAIREMLDYEQSLREKITALESKLAAYESGTNDARECARQCYAAWFNGPPESDKVVATLAPILATFAAKQTEKWREMVKLIEMQLTNVPKTVCGHCKDGLFPAVSDRDRNGLYVHRVGPDGHEELCHATFVYTILEGIRALLAQSPQAGEACGDAKEEGGENE